MTRPRTFSRSGGIAALAIAALLLSGCSLISELTGGGQAVRDGDGQVVDGNDETDVFTLQVGDCLNDGEAGAEVDVVPTVPCDEPHDSEIYASIIMTESEYPGIDAISEFGDAECLAAFSTFVGIDYLDSRLDFSYYYPTEGSWASGDREILCIAYDPAGPVTGSLEGVGE